MQILASAIQAVKSPDIAVEKIEIQTKTEHETDWKVFSTRFDLWVVGWNKVLLLLFFNIFFYIYVKWMQTTSRECSIHIEIWIVCLIFSAKIFFIREILAIAISHWFGFQLSERLNF